MVDQGNPPQCDPSCYIHSMSLVTWGLAQKGLDSLLQYQWLVDLVAMLVSLFCSQEIQQFHPGSPMVLFFIPNEVTSQLGG